MMDVLTLYVVRIAGHIGEPVRLKIDPLKTEHSIAKPD
jgi:hypothetical protein